MSTKDIESRIARLEDRLGGSEPPYLRVGIISFACPSDTERDTPRELLGYSLGCSRSGGGKFFPRDRGETEGQCLERVKSILQRDGRRPLILLEEREKPEQYYRTGEEPKQYRPKPEPLSGKPIQFVPRGDTRNQ